MKKLILATALLATLGSTATMADQRYGYYPNRNGTMVYGPAHGYGGYGRGNLYNNYRDGNTADVLVPMIIGGVVGYAISSAQQPRQVVVQQPQVIQQASQVIQQNDSVTSNEVAYHYENVYLESCSCTRRVLVRD